MKKLIKEDSQIDLNTLSNRNDYSGIDPKVFYPEAASLITFLLREYGEAAFLDFSRQVRDGVKWQNALEKSYRFENLSDFENKWKDYLLKN